MMRYSDYGKKEGGIDYKSVLRRAHHIGDIALDLMFLALIEDERGVREAAERLRRATEGLKELGI